MTDDPIAAAHAAAANLDAESERLGELVVRLEKLCRQQKATGHSWQEDWPDEIQIRIDDMNDAFDTAKRAFDANLAYYPALAGDWRHWKDYFIEKDHTSTNLLRDYGDKARILRKCAKIVRATAEAMRPAPAQSSPVVHNYGGFFVGDTYSANQAGALGPNAHAHDMTFNQVNAGAALDLPALLPELARLRAAMKEQSSAPEHDIAIGQVAVAEAAAGKNDTAGVLSSLKAAGKWSLDVARQIGVKLAADAIMTSMK